MARVVETIPPPITHDEMHVWLDALKRGTGSYAAVARLLLVNVATVQRWRDDDQREWPWWYRNVLDGCVAVVSVRLRGELSRRRKGSHDWNAANAAHKRMMHTLDTLPPRAFDLILKASVMSPNLGTAIDFLEKALAKRPVRLSILRRRAEAEGIAPTTLHRASQKLGVVKRQSGFGAEKVVTWELPDDDA